MEANNCLIYETLNDVKTMKVTKSGDGLMRLSGTFGVCGVKNNNNRIYETNNYRAMVMEMKKRIATNGIPGELEHPQTMNITLENVSHKIDDININEAGEVTGTITLLNTPKGKIAQAIVEGGLPLFISSRASGSVGANGVVTLEHLATYDLVGSPGFSQAKLHLTEGQVAESINESCYYITTPKNVTENTNNTEDMTDLEKRIELLENKIARMQNAEDYCKTVFAPVMEKWVINEFAPVVERWVTEEVMPNVVNENNDTHEDVKAWVMDKVVPGIESWVTSEFAPVVENWVTSEFAPVVESWVTSEFAPVVESWVTSEFAPVVENWIIEEHDAALQKWIVEEYTQEVENWIMEDYSKGLQNFLVEQFAPQIQNWLNEEYTPANNKTSLDNIESTLKMLESYEAPKQEYSRKQMLTEQVSAQGNRSTEPLYIAQMPVEARAQWNMATPDVKEAIKRKAKLYNFNSPTAIQNFWESVDFAATAPVHTVYEGLDNVQDQWERNMRAKIRAHRNR